MKFRLSCLEVSEGRTRSSWKHSIFLPNKRKPANEDGICLSPVTFLHLIRVTQKPYILWLSSAFIIHLFIQACYVFSFIKSDVTFASVKGDFLRLYCQVGMRWAQRLKFGSPMGWKFSAYVFCPLKSLISHASSCCYFSLTSWIISFYFIRKSISASGSVFYFLSFLHSSSVIYPPPSLSPLYLLLRLVLGYTVCCRRFSQMGPWIGTWLF